ncbi:leucine-rich repeat-containing protein 74A-like [Lineus longissimus]|uniref:leucine-rich repeat-containing protein 74A-like n=1 Tax=Lineus longissimus TaxID=88925 RepID=UPI002B4F88BE
MAETSKVASFLRSLPSDGGILVGTEEELPEGHEQVMLTEKPYRNQSGAASRRHSQCSAGGNKSGTPLSNSRKPKRSNSQASTTTSALTKHILAREEQNQRRASGGQQNRSRQPTPLDTAIRNFQRTASAMYRDKTFFEDKDDDLETVLDLTENREEWDSTGQRAYERACEKYGAVPSRRFYKGLADATDIDMSNYGTGPRGTMAVAIPLVINSKCTTLNLDGNDINEEGIMYLSGVMEENTTITHLNLANNNLRSFGAKRLGEMLSTARHISYLNLAGNNFTDHDASVLTHSLEFNVGLKELLLGHNKFGGEAGEIFRKFLTEHQHIVELDLSWNRIRNPGAIRIANSLRDNQGLTKLNLAWNGFEDDGAIAMAMSLRSNTTLKDLDLSCNRVNAKGFIALCKAFSENHTLKNLALCRNPIPDEAAEVGLTFLQTLDELSLSLDLRDVFLKTTFEEVIAGVRQVHDKFQCNFGYSDSYGKRKLNQYSALDEAFRYLTSYVVEHGIQLVDLFARFDVDGSMSVTYDEFKEGLRDAKIPLTPLQVEQLILCLDQDGDGEIDFSELVIGSEEYEHQKRTAKQIEDKLAGSDTASNPR